ncbi:purine-binding chemotaxis protein CheW [Quadrisphaera granulorum]|uniref:Purine-binding chemotaxis protein CheW n=1 Tax=Quadrisphaera granulorum TaxID=317664 RepID=A0A316AD21_9ACTN|nr:chemotaxis protein CheW [Quadrisphaera granulorum]PWJ55655.1 purine-binding chemotaxis protein CheW [Quadrisphaera granulorum]SZE95152.1 purine-binding chemotaxis protein CheW [Quadrisphaera granulorum]
MSGLTKTKPNAATGAAAARLLTFELAGGLYGLEVEHVQEVLRAQKVTRVPLHGAAIAGLINLRGEVVTAIDLRARLSLAPRPEGQDAVNIVVRLHGESISLLVDSIADVVELDDRSFEPVPDTLDGDVRELLRGAYKTEGRLLLALDVQRAVAG